MKIPPNPLGARAQAFWQVVARRIDVPQLLAQIERALEEAALHPDVMQQVDAYAFAADVLAGHTDAPLEECLGWIVEAFGAKEPSLLACLPHRRPASPQLAQRLAEALLEFKVVYRKVAKGGPWQREFTLFRAADKGAVRVQRVEDIDWSDLPETVRADALGSRRTEINFTLWPTHSEPR